MPLNYFLKIFAAIWVTVKHLECCVERQNSHENEICCDTPDENRSGEREGIEEVPEQGKHGHADGDPTDDKSSVLQAEVLLVGELVGHHLLHGVVKGVLDSGAVPLVDLDGLLHLGGVL